MHELIHLKRKDTYYSMLTMIATAMHWFNPIVHLAGRAVELLCEISCDDEVTRGMDADARLRYTETIVGVARYRLRLKTAMSTGFYSGKKGMQERISSIMDMSRKKAGAVLIGGVLILSAGTGFALAVTADSAPVTVDSAPAVNSREILDLLLNLESPGAWVAHNPQDGQIGRDEAIVIAEESVPRLLGYFHKQTVDAVTGMSVAEAYLRKATTTSGQDLDISLFDPKFSFWIITLAASDGACGAEFLIHATTGAVLRAEIYGYPQNADTEVDAGKALNGFIADLGLEETSYDGRFISFTGGVQEIIAFLSPDNTTQAVAQVSGEPYTEGGEAIEGKARITFRLYLTTRNGSEGD
jgi:hypothetical protein